MVSWIDCIEGCCIDKPVSWCFRAWQRSQAGGSRLLAGQELVNTRIEEKVLYMVLKDSPS